MIKLLTKRRAKLMEQTILIKLLKTSCSKMLLMLRTLQRMLLVKQLQLTQLRKLKTMAFLMSIMLRFQVLKTLRKQLRTQLIKLQVSKKT